MTNLTKREEHITTLLRRWLRGDIDRQGEAELDAAARDDNFLAEALEGYRQVPAADHHGQLSHLRRRLARPTQRPILARVNWRLAAAVALLLATGSLVWYLQTNAPTTSAELAEAPAPTATPQAEAAPSAAAPTTSTTSSANGHNPTPAVTTAPPPSAAPEPAAAPAEPPGAAYAGPDAEEMNGFAADETTARREMAAEALAPPPAAPPAPAETRARSKRANTIAPENAQAAPSTAMSQGLPPVPNARLLVGRVSDQSGEPLVGAAISVPGSTQGAVTDFNGQFKLSVPPTATEIQVVYTGYSAQRLTIPPDANLTQPLDVVLQPSLALLDEVTVTGLGRQRTPPSPEARPQGGARRFQRYLRDNWPNDLAPGEVTLRFTVQPDGALTNLTVVQATTPALGAAALELLRTGPRWEVLNGNAPWETTYTLRKE